MRLTKYILLALLTISLQVTAVEKSKDAKLQELVNLMNMDSMIDSMYSQIEHMMQTTATQLGVKPNEQALFDSYSQEMTQVMREEMSWAKMEPVMMEVYSRNFSENEIDDLIVFYNTDTGRAMIQKMPVVMQEAMQASQMFAQKMLPKIQQISQKFEAKLQESRAAN